MIEPQFTAVSAAEPLRKPVVPQPLRQSGNHRFIAKRDDSKLRETFDQFVGEAFYGTMLKAMRKTQGKPAYMNGGRAEEVFQGQLDQALVEKLATATGSDFSGDMFELFQLNRR